MCFDSQDDSVSFSLFAALTYTYIYSVPANVPRNLEDNHFTTLPAGLFEGLEALTEL